MEIFDVVDKLGNPTGQTVERSVAHAEGIRHRTAHIWVVRYVDGRYQVLLQRRCMNKDSFPGCLDTSSAGHIQAGDEPLESALRELGEELGIKAEAKDLKRAGTFVISYQSQFHGKPFKDEEIAFVHVYDKPVDIEKLTLQKEEVDAVEWHDYEEVLQNCRVRQPDICVPTAGIELLGKFLGIL